eukprot:Plantae.Rhodophyta-Hildenbrandia_rubra.ctg2665.p1 GENE.Plantae.Rhodophyta-Hildenbrandia_rubra.ctg2665~~Plantae.Rhodophyta-Hildenbrandia_rubra.ctg2665.p1  ORF type:complete len:796 (-),score=152.44 Plantae.Rhodophyta-Hildenbrandia_rubra.ctg2665:1446-3833(-)
MVKRAGRKTQNETGNGVSVDAPPVKRGRRPLVGGEGLRRSLRVAAQVSAAHLPGCVVSGGVKEPPECMIDSGGGGSSSSENVSGVRGERPSASVLLLTDREPYAAVGQPVYLRVGIRCMSSMKEEDLPELWKQVRESGWGEVGDGEDVVVGLLGVLAHAGVDGRGKGYAVGRFCLLKRCEKLLGKVAGGREVERFRREAADGCGVAALIVWRDGAWEVRGMMGRVEAERKPTWWEELLDDGIKMRAPAGKRVRRFALEEQIKTGWKALEKGKDAEAAIYFTLGTNALRVINAYEDIALEAALRCGRATAAFELGNLAAAISDARVVRRRSSFHVAMLNMHTQELRHSYANHRLRTLLVAGSAHERMNRPWQAYSVYTEASYQESPESLLRNEVDMKIVREGLRRLSDYRIDPTYIIKIELRGLEPEQPPIWRRLAVSGRINLWGLNQVLQIALGRRDIHSHVFVDSDGTMYTRESNEWASPSQDEDHALLLEVLQEPGDTVEYIYDAHSPPIDRWNHRITLEGLKRPTNDEPPHPVCLAGSGATLPDEIGGPSAYYQFLQVLRGNFDKDETNLLPDFLTNPRDAAQYAYSAASPTNCGPSFDVDALPVLRGQALHSSFAAARRLYGGCRHTRSGLRGQLQARRQAPLRRRKRKGAVREDVWNPEVAYCVICAEDVEEGTVLPCGHANFHRQCLGRWFEENLSCPVCRGDMHEKLADLIGWDASACDLDRINSCLRAYAEDMEEEWRPDIGDHPGFRYVIDTPMLDIDDDFSDSVLSQMVASGEAEEVVFEAEVEL